MEKSYRKKIKNEFLHGLDNQMGENEKKRQLHEEIEDELDRKSPNLVINDAERPKIRKELKKHFKNNLMDQKDHNYLNAQEKK